jgi:uncharacterized membrane protein
MICSYCAAPMPDISAFCPECGQAVRADSASSRRNGEFGLGSRQALLGTLAYVTALPAVLFLAVPTLRKDSFVRFHCWQSIFFALATLIVALLMRFFFSLLALLPGVGFLLACLVVGVVLIGLVILWIVLVVKAALGQIYRLPWIGLGATRLAQ